MNQDTAFSGGSPRRRRQVEFLCECGDSACCERVRLDAAAYERLRADGRSVLASGHAPRSGDPQLRPVE